MSLPAVGSWSEGSSWHDRDPISSSIRLPAGRNHNRVEQIIADFLSEPAKMADILITHRLGQLHLDRQDAVIVADHDQIDFPSTLGRAKMTNAGPDGFGGNPHAESDE